MKCPHCSNDDHKLLAIVSLHKTIAMIECISCSKMFTAEVPKIPIEMIERNKLINGV